MDLGLSVETAGEALDQVIEGYKKIQSILQKKEMRSKNKQLHYKEKILLLE